MKNGIVISTSEGTKDFLQELLKSLEGVELPILVVGNDNYEPKAGELLCCVNDWNGFELGAILRGAENFDSFLYLPDTCVVNDQRLIDYLFSTEDSVALCQRFMGYFGKYRTEILRKIGIPKITTKNEAILLETYWNQTYIRVDGNVKIFEPNVPIETEEFTEIHGRKRMVCSNGFITKYKGTYGGPAY